MERHLQIGTKNRSVGSGEKEIYKKIELQFSSSIKCGGSRNRTEVYTEQLN